MSLREGSLERVMLKTQRRRMIRQMRAEVFTHKQQFQHVERGIKHPSDPFLRTVKEMIQDYIGISRSVKNGHLERLGLLYVCVLSAVEP